MGGASGELRSLLFLLLPVGWAGFMHPAGGGLLRGGGGLPNMQAWAESFYKSPAWRQCRAAYLKSVGGLCERCLAKGLYVPGEIIHHRTHLTPENISDPAVALAFDNLECVCRNCHAEEHARLRKRYRFDESGRCVTKIERTDTNVV